MLSEKTLQRRIKPKCTLILFHTLSRISIQHSGHAKECMRRKECKSWMFCMALKDLDLNKTTKFLKRRLNELYRDVQTSRDA